MTEQLINPIRIAPNLGAGVEIDGHWITVNYAKRSGRDGRTRYQWTIIFPDNSEETGDDLQSGCQGGDLSHGLSSLLSFMGACGESVNYSARTGRDSDNVELFPPRVAQFCAKHEDEIGLLSCEIEESLD